MLNNLKYSYLLMLCVNVVHFKRIREVQGFPSFATARGLGRLCIL